MNPFRTIAIACTVTATLAAAPAAEAAFIAVDSFGDDPLETSSCTLRDAVMAANLDAAVDGCFAGQGMDFIVLAPGPTTSQR